MLLMSGKQKKTRGLTCPHWLRQGSVAGPDWLQRTLANGQKKTSAAGERRWIKARKPARLRVRLRERGLRREGSRTDHPYPKFDIYAPFCAFVVAKTLRSLGGVVMANRLRAYDALVSASSNPTSATLIPISASGAVVRSVSAAAGPMNEI
jgi:hypothetical protein